MLTKCEACQHEVSAEATSCPNCGHPVKAQLKKSNFGCLGFAAVGVAALIIIGSLMPNDKGTSGGGSKPSHDNILDDAAFQASNPKYVGAIRSLITQHGFECPALAQLWIEGQSPYGPKLEALCGPLNGQRNAYPNLHYAIYPDQLKVDLCKPFGAFSDDCE